MIDKRVTINNIQGNACPVPDTGEQHDDKKLLILDLDETLIHGTEKTLAAPADFCVGEFYIYERPYVREFLSFCHAHFHLAVWSTGSEDYVREVLGVLTDGSNPFEFIWGRNRCTLKREAYDGELSWRKDLKKVHRLGWPLEQVLMLEDTPENLDRHYGNVIRIDAFEGAADDTELLQLQPFLLKLATVTNVRRIEKRGWKRTR